MQIRLEVPEDVVRDVAGDRDVTRTMIEMVALEGYRTRRLSEEQVRRMLGFDSRLQVHAFLKEHNVYLNYTEQDLTDDVETAREFSQRWSSSQTLRR